MLKRFLSAALALCMVLALLPAYAYAAEGDSASEEPAIWDGTAANSYAGGSGTGNSPYEIKTGADLARMAVQVNAGLESGKCYKLMNDIYLNDISSVDSWDTTPPANTWTRIGNDGENYRFSGTFDGNNHCIYGVYISSSNADYQGLFGSTTREAVIKNLTIKKSYIKGGNYVGGICGYSRCNFTDCHNEAAVTGKNYVGGLTGMGESGSLFLRPELENCSNKGKISGRSSIGGVIGEASTGLFKHCYNVGAVSGTNEYVGGICGKAVYADYCWNLGNITGSRCIGGILGEETSDSGNGAHTSNSFNAGEISGTDYVGGIYGKSYVFSGSYYCTVKDCYNIGNVIGTGDFIGGITGEGGHHDNIISGSGYCAYINCYNVGTCSFGSGPNRGVIFNDNEGYNGEHTTKTYYLEGCCGENYQNRKPSVVVSKTAAEMTAPAFVTALNNGSSSWRQDTDNLYNNGYPILAGIDYDEYRKFSNHDTFAGTKTYVTVVGENTAVKIDVYFWDDPTVSEKDITWTSSDKSVAKVGRKWYDEEGNCAFTEVEGISPGTVEVTFSLKGKEQQTVEVRVEPDRWRFYNNDNSPVGGGLWPAGGGYYITTKDYNQLVKHLDEVDRRRVSQKILSTKKSGILGILGFKDTTTVTYYNVDGAGSEGTFAPWNGSCYGMSTWVCLAARDSSLVEKVFKSPSLYKVEDPDSLSTKTQSAINFYQTQQFLTCEMDEQQNFIAKEQSEQLKTLKEQAGKGKPFIISYEWYTKFGITGAADTSSGQAHTVAGCGLMTGSWQKTVNGVENTYTNRVRIYDPGRIGNEDFSGYDLYFNDNGAWCIPARNIISTTNRARSMSDNGLLQGVTPVEQLNCVDYDTGAVSSRVNRETTVLSTTSRAAYQLGTTAGTHKIQGFSVLEGRDLPIFMESDAAADREAVSTVVLPESDRYTVESEDDFMGFSLVYGNYLEDAVLDGPGAITFFPNVGRSLWKQRTRTPL